MLAKLNPGVWMGIGILVFIVLIFGQFYVRDFWRSR